MSIDVGAQVAIILLACGPCVVIVNLLGQVCTLGRAPHTKKTLPDFHEWCRVTRHPRIFRRLTGCQRTPRVLGVTILQMRKSSMRTESILIVFHMKDSIYASIPKIGNAKELLYAISKKYMKFPNNEKYELFDNHWVNACLNPISLMFHLILGG